MQQAQPASTAATTQAMAQMNLGPLPNGFGARVPRRPMVMGQD
jgi:hypothetical protein